MFNIIFRSVRRLVAHLLVYLFPQESSAGGQQRTAAFLNFPEQPAATTIAVVKTPPFAFVHRNSGKKSVRGEKKKRSSAVSGVA